MARKYELGLKYFSHDTDMAHDRAMRKVTKKFSAFGYGVYCRVLECIYKDGHYVYYDDEFVFDVLDSLNMEDSDTQLIKSIIAYCAEIGLFDKTLYETEHVLTSHGIQTRYFMAKEQSVARSIDKNNTPEYKYLLVDLGELFQKPFVEECFSNNENCFENNAIVCETMQQSKVNKNKLNNKKNNNKKSEDESSHKKTLEERKEEFLKTLIPYIDKYGNGMIDDFVRVWCEPNRSGTLMRFEMQKTWSVGGRLATFYKNNLKWNKNVNAYKRDNGGVPTVISGLSEISKSRRNNQ